MHVLDLDFALVFESLFGAARDFWALDPSKTENVFGRPFWKGLNPLESKLRLCDISNTRHKYKTTKIKSLHTK